MYRERERAIEVASLMLDAGGVVIAFALAFILRIFHDALPLLTAIPSTPWDAGRAVGAEYALVVLANLVTVVVYGRFRGVYRGDRRHQSSLMLRYYLKTLLLSVFVTGAVVFALRISLSRLFFAYFFVFLFLTLLTKQFVANLIYHRAERGDRYRQHALVIGSSSAAAWFVCVVHDAKCHGHELVGVLSSDGHPLPDGINASVLGSVRDLDAVLQAYPVSEVFLVGTGREMADLLPVADRLVSSGIIVSIVSVPRSGDEGIRGRVTEFNGVPVISYGPMPPDRIDDSLRRTVDVSVALLALVLGAPLFLSIGLAIRVFDKGSVLFRQERLGRGGKRFWLFKFRSMRVDAESILRRDDALYRRYVRNDYKLAEHEDPRISPLGHFLRRTSLDELPQFWNVLRGDMTLVGPRPIVPQELEKYHPYEGLFLRATPGLTGQWQTSGRSEVRYPERAFMDLDYIASKTLATDFELIAKTIPAVVLRRGAY